MTSTILSPVLTAERRAEFALRFRECIHAYPYTPQGERHLLAYAAERAAAQRNYAAIISREDEGADVTEAVLRGLLPHSPAVAHGEPDVWVTHIPGIAADFRAQFERMGWVRAQDWPRVSAAVLAFVRHCATTPADLENACDDFARQPGIKGFQTGMLSPILHALRPDAFCLISSAARRVINHFAGTAYTLRLTDFPAANATALHLLDEAQDILRQRHAPDLPPSDLFDLFCHWLVVIKHWNFAATQHWRIAVQDDAAWSAWQREGYIALPDAGISDLAALTPSDYAALRGERSGRARDQLSRLWAFAHEIHEGDSIIAHQGTRRFLGDGTITGPYYYVPGASDPHRLPIRWEATTSQDIHQPSWRTPLGRLDDATYTSLIPPQKSQGEREEIKGRHPEDQGESVEGQGEHKASPLQTVERDDPLAPNAVGARHAAPAQPGGVRISEPGGLTPGDLARRSPTPGGPSIREFSPTYQISHTPDLSSCAAATGMPLATLEHWARAIDRKGQAIIAGPPGTGKTFLAQHLAQALSTPDGMWEMVQFHPAYTYEDFVQGIRPQSGPDERLSYPLVPGRFLAFCRQAREYAGRCVLVIDEINRANLAQVFGEVMALLEYRDRALPLASGGTLQIPANVRLLGTMNTADRSLALVDHALRRRFAILPLPPNDDVLRHYHAGSDFPIDNLIRLLHRVNAAIGDPHYALGISYFLRANLARDLPDIWQMEIEPYLEEIFFDQPEEMEALRWATAGKQILRKPARGASST